MLSRKTKYGLKAMLALAETGGREPVLVSSVAERDALPKKFLEAILLELKRHGLVESRKGKGGGYFLRRPPDDITFGDVIRALEGPLAAVPCVSHTAYARCVECVDEQTCGIACDEGRARRDGSILDQTRCRTSKRVMRERRRVNLLAARSHRDDERSKGHVHETYADMRSIVAHRRPVVVGVGPSVPGTSSRDR
jgi:Rrf2 family protein